MKKNVLFGGIACLALLLAVDNAQAQLLRGRRAARDNGSSQPQMMQQGYVVQDQQGQMQIVGPGGRFSQVDAYTSISGQPQMMQDSSQVLLRVLCQPNARISIEGQSVQQQPGMQRMYISPPLDRSQSYVYTVRASWEQNGQMMSRERRVQCTPGQQVTVSLMDDSQQQQQQQSGQQLQQRSSSQQQQQQQSQPTRQQLDQ